METVVERILRLRQEQNLEESNNSNSINNSSNSNNGHGGHVTKEDDERVIIKALLIMSFQVLRASIFLVEKGHLRQLSPLGPIL